MTGRRWLRGGVALLAIFEGVSGLYALIFPLTFYQDIPLPGHPWVALLPPYNQHLVTDYGILSLSLTVTLTAAAVTLDPKIVRVALGSYLVWAVLHLEFHLTHLQNFPLGDAVVQTGMMALFAVLTILLLVLAWRAPSAVNPGARARK